MPSILSVGANGILRVEQGILRAGPANTYAGLVLASNPVAYWRAGESSGPTLTDISGNGFTATENGAAMRYGQSGLISGAPDDDGSVGGNNVQADHWTFGTNATLEPTVSVSIECWCQPNTINEALAQYASFNASDGAGYKLLYGFGGNFFRFYLATNSGSNANSSGNAYIQSPTSFAPGSIYHVVGTYTSGSRILYVNGVSVASDTKAGTIQYPTISSQVPSGLIGNEFFNGSTSSGTPLDGEIDEIAIYDTVLSPATVLAHYNAGAFGTF